MSTPQNDATASIDADIAAFLAAGNKPDEDQPTGTPEAASTNEPDPDDDEPNAAEADQPEGDEESGGGEPAEESATFKVDPGKLVEAIEKKDIAALLEAMGPAADEMLSSKAHATLRLQAKDIKKAQDAAARTQADAKELATKLKEKYGDPIDARKAAEAGDVDAFVGLVEKWSGGHSWNDLMKWVGKGLQGRTERLEAKAKDDKKASSEAQTKRDQAIEETKSWISSSLKKSHANVLDAAPDVVDMVLVEIRDGHAKGIDSPLKAIPLVMKKLQQRHEALGKLFAAKKTKKSTVRSPSTKIGEDGTKRETRELSLEESIAQYVKENRPR
jgi:hypothetical protein